MLINLDNGKCIKNENVNCSRVRLKERDFSKNKMTVQALQSNKLVFKVTELDKWWTQNWSLENDNHVFKFCSSVTFCPPWKSASICDNLNLAELKHRWTVSGAVLDDHIFKSSASKEEVRAISKQSDGTKWKIKPFLNYMVCSVCNTVLWSLKTAPLHVCVLTRVRFSPEKLLNECLPAVKTGVWCFLITREIFWFE